MAKRERFTRAIKCPKCGTKGQATYEDNENPVHGGGLGTVLISVPEQFRMNGEIISCRECGVEVPQ